jgi:hypothetical protein
MAHSYTNTRTQTYTRARMHLIRVQFKSFASRFHYSDSCIEALPDAIKDGLVSALIVYANNEAGQTVASVDLHIDWTAHDELKETLEVTIDARWKDDVSPQVDIFGEGFEEFVASKDLTLNRRVVLSDKCRANPELYEVAMERLGLVPGEKVVWKADPIGQSERLRGLAEMSTGHSYVDDE